MWTTMTVVYFVCAAAGFLVALLGAIFGELGEFFGGNAGVDVGGNADIDVGSNVVVAGSGGMPEASVLNSITIATFVGIFGFAGLIATWVFGFGPFVSLLIALPSAVVMAAVQFILYVKLFVHAQASSEATSSDLLGCEGEIITSVPAKKIGEVAYVIKGSRYTAPAVSRDGVEIPRGSKVLIIEAKGATLVVSPMEVTAQ